MTITFDGLTLTEPEVKPLTTPKVKETELVSGETKVTVSTKTKKGWQISCICTLAEYAALIDKVGYKKTLVIDGTSHTNCAIKTWKDKEINPSTIEVTMTFVRDTTS